MKEKELREMGVEDAQVRKAILKKEMIDDDDMELFKVVNNADEAMAYLLECHKNLITSSVKPL